MILHWAILFVSGLQWVSFMVPLNWMTISHIVSFTTLIKYNKMLHLRKKVDFIAFFTQLMRTEKEKKKRKQLKVTVLKLVACLLLELVINNL